MISIYNIKLSGPNLTHYIQPMSSTLTGHLTLIKCSVNVLSMCVYDINCHGILNIHIRAIKLKR